MHTENHLIVARIFAQEDERWQTTVVVQTPKVLCHVRTQLRLICGLTNPFSRTISMLASL